MTHRKRPVPNGNCAHELKFGVCGNVPRTETVPEPAGEDAGATLRAVFMGRHQDTKERGRIQRFRVGVRLCLERISFGINDVDREA
jgi:hypothetical protein